MREAIKGKKNGGTGGGGDEGVALNDDEDWATKLREKVAARGQGGSRKYDTLSKIASEEDKKRKAPTSGSSRDEDEEGEEGEEDVDNKNKKGRFTSEERKAKSSAAIVRPSKQIQGNAEDKALLNAWERRRHEYKERKRLTGNREKDTLSKLHGFLDKLKSGKNKKVEGGGGGDGDGDDDNNNHESKTDEEGEKGYDGKIDKEIDHRAYMPAAWRLDTYLDDDRTTLESLTGHRLEFKAAAVTDPNARREHVDDYVVVDPLLEAGKEKFNREQQRRKKRQNEWSGRSRD